MNASFPTPPHLTPIENPTSPVMKFAYAWSRRTFGKVMTPMKVIYARVPPLAMLEQKIHKTMDGLSLESELKLLVQIKVSQLNGCPFCEDIGRAVALQKRIGTERFRHLHDYSCSDQFTPREKVALAFAEEATRDKRVSDATWKSVKELFSETEIVELTWLNAAENYFNLQAAVLGIESDNLAEIARGK